MLACTKNITKFVNTL